MRGLLVRKAEDKLSRIKELVRGMPPNTIFKIDKDIYVGVGGFVIKEGEKVFRIDFGRAEENRWLRNKLESISDRTLDMCFELKREYEKLRSLEDKSRIERIGFLVKELEEREFTPDVCTFNKRPKLVSGLNKNVYVIRGLPKLDPSGAPPLPQRFRNLKELEDFATSLVRYLNEKTGERIQLRIVKSTEGLPFSGSYQASQNTIELEVNPDKVSQIPPSAVAGVVAHEYGHGLVKEYIQLLEKSWAYIYGDDEEENAFIRLLDRQSERWADKIGRDITDALYGLNVYKEMINYIYSEARKQGIKPVNEESTRKSDDLRAYPTFFEREEGYPQERRRFFFFKR